MRGGLPWQESFEEALEILEIDIEVNDGCGKSFPRGVIAEPILRSEEVGFLDEPVERYLKAGASCLKECMSDWILLCPVNGEGIGTLNCMTSQKYSL
jgi:hypothetical protein